MRRNQFLSDLFRLRPASLSPRKATSEADSCFPTLQPCTAPGADCCLSPSFSLQRSPPIDGLMGATRGLAPMSSFSQEPQRAYPGELIVRTRPTKDFDMPSVYWSEIASTLVGRQVSLGTAEGAVLFEQAPLLQSAYQLALQSIASPSSLKACGIPVQASLPHASALNNIALPALRDLINQQIISGAPISQEVILVALLQFVPARERATFFAAFCPSQGAAIEELIELSMQALFAPPSQQGTPEQYTRLMSSSDELVAWTHLAKSYCVMAAHLCAPNESSQIRKGAYVMNDVFGVRASPLAHERISNRGQVLESIGW